MKTYTETENREEKIYRAFWERNQDIKKNSQYGFLLSALLKKIQSETKYQDLSEFELEEKFGEGEKILDAITDALKANWKDAPKDRFWDNFDNSFHHDRPDEWGNACSPIDPKGLDIATANYLDKPWMQLNALDWYIMNGFAVDGILRLIESIKSGSAFGEINWAHTFSGGKYISTLYWRMGLSISKFISKWVFLPAIAGLAFYFGYESTAKWTLGIFITLLFFQIIFIPSKLIRWRERRRQLDILIKKLDRLFDIYATVRSEAFNPTILKNRIYEAENEGILIQPAIYSILDRAIMRDPAVFTK
jgi:hypothetical protein